VYDFSYSVDFFRFEEPAVPINNKRHDKENPVYKETYYPRGGLKNE
jgi:hypothetical protein